jgi:DNA-binding beta-propeller fold protein YncE
MRRVLPFCLLVCLPPTCVPIAAQQAPIPTSTALSGEPFFVKKSWPIGGSGNWDYLTLDPAARRLYIAHGHAVQVVDVDSGSVVGEIPGFRDAHAIALDDTGQYGYVSDGPANAVAVFDRSALRAKATIAIGCSPRFIVFEPRSKLVFAFCPPNLPASPPARPGERPIQPSNAGSSLIVAIDTEKNAVLASVQMNGDFHIAQADGYGSIYATVARPAWIAKLDAVGIGAEAHRRREASPKQTPGGPILFDWSKNGRSLDLLQNIPLHTSCLDPQGLAVDGKNQRLFIACENQGVQVLNANTGDLVAPLTTGPGDDVIGYDPERELIYSANGGGYGSLTIVQQDANTDSYAVIQNLPTLARARTLAVDPSSGAVYLVTDLRGVDLTKMGGIGTLHFDPIPGSFQVLVVGH